MNEPVRAAVLTPLEPGGIAVVSLTGPHAIDLLRRVFQPTTPTADWPADQLHFGRLADGHQVLDDAIVVVRTVADGTARVDFNVHGGPRIVQRLLLALEHHGATIVSTDEIAADAWPAASTIEREVYALLPNAQTRRAAAWLSRQRELLPAALCDIAALAVRDMARARARAGELLDTYAVADRMLAGASIVLTGPTNAGKSTLANALCGKPRVLVSPEAGTTRDYVSEPAAIDGVPVTVIDTAGVREPADALEAEAITRARRQAAEADLRLLVLDGHAVWTPADGQFLNRFAPDDPSLVVVNKADLTAEFELEAVAPAWASAAVAASAQRGDSLDELRHRIVSALGFSEAWDAQPAVFSRRQLDGLRPMAVADSAAIIARQVAQLIG